jgi:hypothetical protein
VLVGNLLTAGAWCRGYASWHFRQRGSPVCGVSAVVVALVHRRRRYGQAIGLLLVTVVVPRDSVYALTPCCLTG